MEFPKSGRNDDRWYNWNISNWGTKWDINGSVEIDDYDDEQIEINFSTAWGSFPIEICNKLRDMFPEVGFSWFYDDFEWKQLVSINEKLKLEQSRIVYDFYEVKANSQNKGRVSHYLVRIK